MPTTVTLSPRMRRQAERIARRRVMNDRTVYGRAEGELSEGPLSRHLIGALGEFAFATHYDLEVNSDDQWTDPGYDFLVDSEGDRVTVDVKTTRHRDGALLVPTDQVDADWYVVAYVSDVEATEVDLLGKASSSVVLNGSTESSPVGDWTNRLVSQAELRPLPDQASLQPYDARTDRGS
jgi:hypothetical protein